MNRIALFLPNWVGDVVMATPAVRAVRAAYPERNQLVQSLQDEMYLHFIKELGEDEFAAVKADYDDAFTMALHKDVRKGII